MTEYRETLQERLQTLLRHIFPRRVREYGAAFLESPQARFAKPPNPVFEQQPFRSLVGRNRTHSAILQIAALATVPTAGLIPIVKACCWATENHYASEQ